MRKTAKKLLALILTLAMLASTFAMAMTTVSAEEDDGIYTEDFENSRVLANYGYLLAGYTTADVSVELAADPADANNKVLAFQAIQNKPEASLTFGDLADADTYTVSFKYYFDYAAGVAGADNGYVGFRFGPNGSDWNNVARCFWWKNAGSTCQVNQFADGKIDAKAPTAPETVVALPVDQWVNVVITKVDNNTLTLSINGKVHTMDFDVANFAGKTPYLNFKVDGQYKNKLLIDDLQVTETVGGNTTTYDKQTFTDSKNGGVVTEDVFGGDFKLENLNSPFAGFMADPTDANNRVFCFRDSSNTNNRARILLADEKKSAYYALTGKIYIEAFISGFQGVSFELTNRNNGECMQIMNFRANNYNDIGASNTDKIKEMDAAKRWGVVKSIENGGKEVQPVYHAFSGSQWMNFELTRNGSTVALTIWFGDAKPATPTIVNEFEGLGNTPTLLSMLFNGNGNNAAVYVDDLKFVDETNNIRVGGAQASTAVTNNEYAVRFIGVLNSTVEYDTLGFEVVAHYTDGGVAKTKTFKLDTCKAYTSVLASNGANLGAYEVTAQELGGEYLIALNITNIPVTLGAVTFEVKAIAYVDGEINTVSRAVSYVATPNGDAVALAKA